RGGTGMRLMFACPLLLASCSAAPAPTPRQTTLPISSADTVLAIFTQDWGLRSAGGPRLVLAVWDDGKVVWSEDHLEGGSPYRAAAINPGRLKSLLSRLENDGHFSDDNLSRSHFGPDSRFTTILVRSGKKELKMRSWHELGE